MLADSQNYVILLRGCRFFAPLDIRVVFQESDNGDEAGKDEKMDVDEPSKKEGSAKPADDAEEDYSEVMNDPEFLQV